MKKKKSERHHWWPEAVSRFWKNQNGCVHWLLPDGSVRTAPPKNFGVIGNAHFIKLGRTIAEDTAWDENFEKEFQRADDQFPRVIGWLQTLSREDRTSGFSRRERYIPHPTSDKMLCELVEGIVSLVIRSRSINKKTMSPDHVYQRICPPNFEFKVRQRLNFL